jgi:NAD(P)-dependent dehydrogenase (short-subunit alcohol dehydrogenase family)
MTFGPDSTTEEVLGDIDLTGKRAIVTGGSSGIGQETVRALASRGAAVTLAARDQAKAEVVAEGIRHSTGSRKVDVGIVELASPASIRAFAEHWLGEHDALDLLINNAGVMACPLARTAEGWEMQFATNHLGHFLLTCLLAPALKAAAAPRVVNLSSAGHRFGGVDFDDVHFERRAYDKWAAYGQSKTANILFSVELSRRLAGAGVTANAVHPGVIATELGRHLGPDDIAALQARGALGAFTYKSIPAGAATSVWAATAPELAGRGGLYLEDCHVAPRNEDPAVRDGYRDYAVDPELAARLWAYSEAALGERFDLA